MGKRNYYVLPHELREENPTIEGFEIPLNEGDARRIARLVHMYESNILTQVDEEYVRKTRWSDKLADRIASFGGSWTFLCIFGGALGLWILWNTLQVTHSLRFDKPPFILLNLCLSFIAAFQAPIIMMSQNRQAARDKHESVIDFAINYKAEREIDDMQSHLHRIEGKLMEVEKLLVALNGSQAAEAKVHQHN